MVLSGKFVREFFSDTDEGGGRFGGNNSERIGNLSSVVVFRFASPHVLLSFAGVNNIEDVLLSGLVSTLSNFNGEGPGTSAVVSSGDDSVLGVKDSPSGDISRVVLVAGSEGELEGESCVTGGERVHDFPLNADSEDDQKSENEGSH